MGVKRNLPSFVYICQSFELHVMKIQKTPHK